jgi:DNA gyrase/topoisomerase IV subunit B
MEKNEHNYKESDIKMLDFHEAVRLRPAMYIGSAGTSGGFYLIKEIVKELLALYPETEFDFGLKKENEITFSFETNGNKVSDLVSFFEKSTSWRENLFSLFVATALTDYFRLSIKGENKTYSCEYIDGKLVSVEDKSDFSPNEIIRIEIKFSLVSSIISFAPEDMWKFIQCLHALACMHPQAKIFVDDERGERKTSLTIHRPHGLLELFYGNFAYYRHWADDEFSKSIYFSGIRNNISYQIMIDYHNDHFKGLKKMFFLNAELCGENCSHEIAIKKGILEVAQEMKSKDEDLAGAAFERTIDSLNIYAAVFELERVADLDYVGPTKHNFVSESIFNDIKSVTIEKLRSACAANENLCAVFASIGN